MIYYLYAWGEDDLETARHRLDPLLPGPADARWSDFAGGDYYRWTDRDRLSATLQPNYPDEDGVPLEAEVPACQLLVYVTATGRDPGLEQRLTAELGLRLVRRAER